MAWVRRFATKHMGHESQEVRRTPAADEHIPFRSYLKDFPHRVTRETLPIDFPPLKKRGLTFEKTMYLTLVDTGALRDTLRNELVMNDRQAKALRQPGR